MERAGIPSRNGGPGCLGQGQPGAQVVKEEREEHQDVMDGSQGHQAAVQSFNEEILGAEQAENAEATTPMHAHRAILLNACSALAPSSGPAGPGSPYALWPPHEFQALPHTSSNPNTPLRRSLYQGLTMPSSPVKRPPSATLMVQPRLAGGRLGSPIPTSPRLPGGAASPTRATFGAFFARTSLPGSPTRLQPRTVEGVRATDLQGLQSGTLCQGNSQQAPSQSALDAPPSTAPQLISTKRAARRAAPLTGPMNSPAAPLANPSPSMQPRPGTVLPTNGSPALAAPTLKSVCTQNIPTGASADALPASAGIHAAGATALAGTGAPAIGAPAPTGTGSPAAGAPAPAGTGSPVIGAPAPAGMGASAAPAAAAGSPATGPGFPAAAAVPAGMGTPAGQAAGPALQQLASTARPRPKSRLSLGGAPAPERAAVRGGGLTAAPPATPGGRAGNGGGGGEGGKLLARFLAQSQQQLGQAQAVQQQQQLLRFQQSKHVHHLQQPQPQQRFQQSEHFHEFQQQQLPPQKHPQQQLQHPQQWMQGHVGTSLEDCWPEWFKVWMKAAQAPGTAGQHGSRVSNKANMGLCGPEQGSTGGGDGSSKGSALPQQQQQQQQKCKAERAEGGDGLQILGKSRPQQQQQQQQSFACFGPPGSSTAGMCAPIQPAIGFGAPRGVDGSIDIGGGIYPNTSIGAQGVFGVGNPADAGVTRDSKMQEPGDEESTEKDSSDGESGPRRRGKGKKAATKGGAQGRKKAGGCAAGLAKLRAGGVQKHRSNQRTGPRPEGGTSKRKGVTRHRHTLRWEAHLWDSSAPRKVTGKGGRTRGKQVYLGGFSTESDAARAYDRAAIVYWGTTAQLNGNLSDYEDELDVLMNISREEVVQMLRRNSSGFTRGASTFRGVTRHCLQNKWEARIGRIPGSKYLYLGTFDTQLEAAVAYDHAALKHRGHRAVTNFPRSNYFTPGFGNQLIDLAVAQAVAPHWPRPNLPTNASTLEEGDEGEEDEGSTPSPSHALQQQQQQQQVDLPSASPRPRPSRPQRAQRRRVKPAPSDTTSSGGSTTEKEEEEEEEESTESEEWSGAEACMPPRVGKRGCASAGKKRTDEESAWEGCARGEVANSVHGGEVGTQQQQQRAKLRVRKANSSSGADRQVGSGAAAAAAGGFDKGRAGGGMEREWEEASSGEGGSMDVEGGAKWWESECGGFVRHSMRGSAKAARVMETGVAGAGASARGNSLGLHGGMKVEGEEEGSSAVSRASDQLHQQQQQQQQPQKQGRRRLAVPQVGVVAVAAPGSASIGFAVPAVPPVAQHPAAAGQGGDLVWALGRPQLQQQQQQQQQQRQCFGAGVAAAAVGGSVGSCLPSFGGPLPTAAASVAAATSAAAAPCAPLRTGGPPAGLAIRPIRTSEAQTKQLTGVPSQQPPMLAQQKAQQAGSSQHTEEELLLHYQHTQLLGLAGSNSTPGSSASVLLPSFWEGMASPKSADLLGSLLSSPFSGGAAAQALTPLAHNHFSPRLSPSMLLSPRFTISSLLFSPRTAQVNSLHNNSSGSAMRAPAHAALPPNPHPSFSGPAAALPPNAPLSFAPAAALPPQAPSAAATVQLRGTQPAKANAAAKTPATSPFNDPALPTLGQLMDSEVMELLQGLSPTYRPLPSPFSSSGRALGWH